jgi:SAM-dependent methyltransferase
MRRRKLALRRRLIERYSHLGRGTILDVGCATGLFLHEMALAGWDAAGVELSGAAAEYGRARYGLQIHEGTLEEATLAAASLDVITYWDVLEHTFSPRAELEHAATLLRPGGLLVINVPNFGSAERWVFGPYWIGFDPPRHLYVFSRATLARLLAETGFAILGWRCMMPSFFSATVSLDRLLNARMPRWAVLVNRLLSLPGARFPFEPALTLLNWLHLGGTIAVFACLKGAQLEAWPGSAR